MARPGHGRARPSGEEDEEDPLDARIRRSGCLAQHRALQECMAEQQDWRRCQPQVREFGACMARRQRAQGPLGASGPGHGQPSPAGS